MSIPGQMLAIGELVNHWGYLAICLVIILGNVGLPIPEETILALAGYLVWKGRVRFALVLGVGIASAIAGDNLGYWIGRHYGPGAINRYGHWILLTPARVDSARRFVARHGAVAVFAARFMMGFRFLAGPLAGVTGLQPLRFLVASLLGASIYIPLAVCAGYAIGYGLGEYVERIRGIVDDVEYFVLLVTILATLALLGWRALCVKRTSRAGRGYDRISTEETGEVLGQTDVRGPGQGKSSATK
jgi:membrane protein DedA with SNARE-associated domain